MNRPIALLPAAGLVGLAVLGLVFVSVLQEPTPGVTLENFQRLHEGMTRDRPSRTSGSPGTERSRRSRTTGR